MMLLAANILIVDDEQAIADLVELILKMRTIMSLNFITARMLLTVLKMKN